MKFFKTVCAGLIAVSALAATQSSAWTPTPPAWLVCKPDQSPVYTRRGGWACVDNGGTTQPPPPTSTTTQLAVYDSSVPPKKLGAVVQADMHYSWVIYDFEYSQGKASTIFIVRKDRLDDGSDYTNVDLLYFLDGNCSSSAYIDFSGLDSNSLMSPNTAVISNMYDSFSPDKRAILLAAPPSAQVMENFVYESTMTPRVRVQRIWNEDLTYEDRVIAEASECVSESGQLDTAIQVEQVEDLLDKFTPPFHMR